MVSKGGNTSRSVVNEEFKIEKGSTTTREPGEDLLPSSLLLVAMGELNMDMFERDCADVRNFPV
jgi:hypothetical protein